MKKPKILTLEQWTTPASQYPLTEHGTARIQRYPQEPGLYHFYRMLGYDWVRIPSGVTTTSLEIHDGVGWRTWMVDDPSTTTSLHLMAQGSRGNVLTSGLGLGLVCHTLVGNPLVKSVTVIERSPDVVSLIQPLIPQAIQVIQDDFYRFIRDPRQSVHFDTIIVDLWVSNSWDESLDILKDEVAPLCVELRALQPTASINFHGFPPLSNIKISGPSELDRIRSFMSRQDDRS